MGTWVTTPPTSQRVDAEVAIDLLVAAPVSPVAGRRAAKAPGHESHAARIVKGRAGAIVDANVVQLTSLEATDAQISTRSAIAAPTTC